MRALWLFIAVPGLVLPAYAEVKGTFIGPGNYATAKDCKKFAAIEAGGDKNVATAPEVLTVDGIQGWEGGCSFTSIAVTNKGKVWTAKMACIEGPDEGTQIYVFKKLSHGRFKVTTQGQTDIYQRCDDGKGK